MNTKNKITKNKEQNIRDILENLYINTEETSPELKIENINIPMHNKEEQEKMLEEYKKILETIERKEPITIFNRTTDLSSSFHINPIDIEEKCPLQKEREKILEKIKEEIFLDQWHTSWQVEKEINRKILYKKNFRKIEEE